MKLSISFIKSISKTKPNPNEFYNNFIKSGVLLDGGILDIDTNVYLKLLNYNNRSVTPPSKMPSFGQKVVNLSKSIITIGKSTLNGNPLLQTKEEIARRRDICLGCEKWIDGACSICGCNCKAKTPFYASSCPINKW
jgi:hypothetical protein